MFSTVYKPKIKIATEYLHTDINFFLFHCQLNLNILYTTLFCLQLYFCLVLIYILWQNLKILTSYDLFHVKQTFTKHCLQIIIFSILDCNAKHFNEKHCTPQHIVGYWCREDWFTVGTMLFP